MPERDLRDLANYLSALPGAFERASERALRRTQKKALSLAKRLSSGRKTPRDLRKLGAPFARRHGLPILDPSEVNAQREDGVAGSWRAEDPVREGDTLVARVVNDAPESEFLAGTKRMFPRPIADRVLAECTPDLERALAEELARELTPP